MESDPAAVPRVAIPAAVRAGLPAAIQPDVEEEVALDGEMQVFHEDYAQHSRYRHFLQTPTERLSLHFAGEAPKLLTGTRVRVRDVRLGEALALNGSGGSVQPLSSVAPNIFGAQKTIVILVNFQDNAVQPYSLSQARRSLLVAVQPPDSLLAPSHLWLALPRQDGHPRAKPPYPSRDFTRGIDPRLLSCCPHFVNMHLRPDRVVERKHHAKLLTNGRFRERVSPILIRDVAQHTCPVHGLEAFNRDRKCLLEFKDYVARSGTSR